MGDRADRRMLARIRSIVRRGVVNRTNSDSDCQSVQASTLADDVADDVEHFEPYGFTSNPPSGSEGVVLLAGADTAHSIIVNVGDRRVRLAGLASGEVAVYHRDGASVVLRDNGDIEVFPADGGQVHLGGPGGSAVAREGDPTSTPALDDLLTAINAWVPAPTDGGAALKTALASWLGQYALTAGDGEITAGGEGSTST